MSFPPDPDQPRSRVGNNARLGSRRFVGALAPTIKPPAGRARIQNGIRKPITALLAMVPMIEQHIGETISSLARSLQRPSMITVLENPSAASKLAIDSMSDANFQAAKAQAQ